MGEIAEGIFVDVEAGIRGDIDLPFRDILAVMAARRHPQDLDDATGRWVVAVGGGVEDFQAHGGRSGLRAGTIQKAERDVMSVLACTVIPGRSAGPSPESRDSGFASSRRPGMTMQVVGIKSNTAS